jgi:hypothetical protein
LVTKNLKKQYGNPVGFFSIKLDEIAISQRIRWCPETNEFIGLCYNHKEALYTFQFHDLLNVNDLHDNLKDGNIHAAKEALVICILRLGSEDRVPKPILCLPICSHSTTTYVKEAIQIILEYFRNYSNSIVINIATDEDATRRYLLNEVRSTNRPRRRDQEDPFALLSDLHLFD